MTYFRKNSNQNSRSASAAKRSKQDRRWTLLFIGNHGRTITLKRFKGMLILALAVLLLSIGFSVGLFTWNLKIIMENHDLQNDLDALNNRIDTLRHDKDILMARLVVAETKAQPDSVDRTEAPVPEESAHQEQSMSDEKAEKTQAATEISQPPAHQQNDSPPNNEPIESGLSVAVENFEISNQSSDNRLKIMFKVKNTSPNSQRISGHAIVVLKGKDTNWLPIPWMSLVDGRPTGKSRGHSFGINYFKTMRLSTRAPKSPEKFDTATIFVFTRQGELLLEKEYPVQLPPNRPVENKPAASLPAVPVESAPASSPAAPSAETPPATQILGLPPTDASTKIPTATDAE